MWRNKMVRARAINQKSYYILCSFKTKPKISSSNFILLDFGLCQIILFPFFFCIVHTHPFDWNACIHTQLKFEIWNRTLSMTVAIVVRFFFWHFFSLFISFILFFLHFILLSFFLSLQFTFFDCNFLWFFCSYTYSFCMLSFCFFAPCTMHSY